MAYLNGTATTIAALRTALIDACTAAGWTWNAGTEVLSKGLLFAQLTVSATNLHLVGRTAAGTGDAPNRVSVGRLCATAGYPTFDFVFPIQYHIFTFDDPDEVYLVVNYSIDTYQFLAFGQSGVAGLTGTGMWIAGTLGGDLATPSTSAGGTGVAFIGPGFGGNGNVNNDYVSPAWGCCTRSILTGRTTFRNLFVHSGLDAQPWHLAQALTDAHLGVTSFTELLVTQPSAWNSESALIPMRAYKVRAANRVSLVADLAHARHVRIDNYEPGQVIEIGPDRWKCFPWLRKDGSARDGAAGTSFTASINHSGTFGWAIRYEGP
jgi:hypothetical protein